ncbi:MAG: DUF4347 domain-containing protein, partial [Desulfarculus sp.]|nr:DUF4347 domain-containing protein [Desulfarculus sp.]
MSLRIMRLEERIVMDAAAPAAVAAATAPVAADQPGPQTTSSADTAATESNATPAPTTDTTPSGPSSGGAFSDANTHCESGATSTSLTSYAPPTSTSTADAQGTAGTDTAATYTAPGATDATDTTAAAVEGPQVLAIASTVSGAEDLAAATTSNVIATITAATGTAAEGPQVLAIASTVSGAENLAAATTSNVIATIYDAQHDTLDQVLEQIHNLLGDVKAASIALAASGGNAGDIRLTQDCTVTADNLLAQPEITHFWAALGAMIAEGGRLDILACDVTASEQGLRLVNELEQVTQHEVAASDDRTGNALAGGDWLLEKGNVDAVATYFDAAKLANFQGAMGVPVVAGLDSATFNENTVNATPQVIDSDITFSSDFPIIGDTGNIKVYYTIGGGTQDSLGIFSGGLITVQGGTLIKYDFAGDGSDFQVIGSVDSGHQGLSGQQLWVNLDTGVATDAAVQELLRHLTYTNSSDAPTATRTIGITVDDGNGAGGGISAEKTSQITVTPQNDNPTLTGLNAKTFNENDITGGAQVIDSAVVFADPANPADLNGGQLRVRYTVGGAAQDSLSIQNQGAGAGQIGFDGTNVTYGGVIFGTINGVNTGASGAELRVDLNASSTVTAVDALLEHLTYANSFANNPLTASPTLTRTIGITVSDGQGGSTVERMSVITVNSQNDAPVITKPADQTTNEEVAKTFSAAGGNQISIADVDAGTANLTAAVSVSHGALTVAAGSEAFITAGANNTATFTLTGTVAQINTALDGLVYTPTGNYDGADSLAIVVHDQGNTGPGGDMSDSESVGITVNGINDAPVITKPSALVSQFNVPFYFGGTALLIVVGVAMDTMA